MTPISSFLDWQWVVKTKPFSKLLETFKYTVGGKIKASHVVLSKRSSKYANLMNGLMMFDWDLLLEGDNWVLLGYYFCWFSYYILLLLQHLTNLELIKKCRKLIFLGICCYCAFNSSFIFSHPLLITIPKSEWENGIYIMAQQEWVSVLKTLVNNSF